MAEIIADYLTKNRYSRPGKKRHSTDGLVVHWVANPGTSAQHNRDFFENLKDGLNNPRGGKWFASTAYIVGIEGEIIQCMPDWEVHYHVGSRNYTPLAQQVFGKYATYKITPNWVTLGVELCHPDWSGEFTEKTLESATGLFARLCFQYNLSEQSVYRHNDIVGWKHCPKWFIDHPEAFDEFRQNIKARIKNMARIMEEERHAKE